jgi:peptide/nickel transport system permease protein
MAGTLLIISFLTYATFALLPADPARASCGRPCTPDRLAEVRAFLGTDKPWTQQFLGFLGGIVRGREFGSGTATIHCSAPCLGYSFQLNEPVTRLLAERAPVTFSIVAGAALLWLLIGVTAGVAAAVHRGSVLDRSVLLFSTAGISAPAYLVGLLSILLFGFVLHVVPVGGYVPLTENPVDWAWHLLLPWTVLAVLSAAFYARLSRTQMLEELGAGYLRTARAKGLRERRVLSHHALRNVLIPIVTVFGLDLGGLLGGAALSERVFSMQGLGALLLDAVATVDLPLLLGSALFSAFLVIAANVVVDVLYSVLDPRVAR